MNCRRFLRLILCTLCLLPPLLAGAQQGHSALYRAVDDFLRTQTRGLPGKVSFRVTPLDPRTQLAECEVFDTFFPTGSGPWGKTTIGVRCLSPSSWTIYVQAHVSVQANYLVAARALVVGRMKGELIKIRLKLDLQNLE